MIAEIEVPDPADEGLQVATEIAHGGADLGTGTPKREWLLVKFTKAESQKSWTSASLSLLRNSGGKKA